MKGWRERKEGGTGGSERLEGERMGRDGKKVKKHF